MRREGRERFPRHRGLAIPTCITARTSRTCRDAVSFGVGGGENVPGIRMLIVGNKTLCNFSKIVK